MYRRINKTGRQGHSVSAEIMSTREGSQVQTLQIFCAGHSINDLKDIDLIMPKFESVLSCNSSDTL